MTERKIGILHPGNMGISIAASMQNSGNAVYWASEGRSAQTRERAEKFDLLDARTLAELCKICSVIVCVCPPHAAEDVANQTAQENNHVRIMDIKDGPVLEWILASGLTQEECALIQPGNYRAMYRGHSARRRKEIQAHLLSVERKLRNDTEVSLGIAFQRLVTWLESGEYIVPEPPHWLRPGINPTY